jgi:hypothetical protein
MDQKIFKFVDTKQNRAFGAGIAFGIVLMMVLIYTVLSAKPGNNYIHISFSDIVVVTLASIAGVVIVCVAKYISPSELSNIILSEQSQKEIELSFKLQKTMECNDLLEEMNKCLIDECNALMKEMKREEFLIVKCNALMKAYYPHHV